MIDDPPRALLLACLHQDPRRLAAFELPPDDSPQWDALVALATEQRVRPRVYQRVKAAAIGPDRVRHALASANRQIGLHNLRLQGELAAVAGFLRERDIPVAVLKGAHLIASVYAGVAQREMSDLDILVRREHLPAAVDAVKARGYQPYKTFSIDLDVALSNHLARFTKRDVGSIEIHWSITIPTDAHHVDPAGLWVRAVPLRTAGADVWGLAREDLLLHVCAHTSYQHQFRIGLRPFCDIAATIASDPARIDWPALVERAKTWNWARGVHLSLTLAHELVGAEVPGHVLDALKPAGFDQTVLDAAATHVFATPSAAPLEPGVARLAGAETALARLRHLAARVFVPRQELARAYGLSPDSKRLPLYYAVRIKELVERYNAHTVRLLVTHDPELTAAAERTNTIRRWLQ